MVVNVSIGRLRGGGEGRGELDGGGWRTVSRISGANNSCSATRALMTLAEVEREPRGVGSWATSALMVRSSIDCTLFSLSWIDPSLLPPWAASSPPLPLPFESTAGAACADAEYE